MKKMRHEHYFGLVLAAIALLLLWLMNKAGVLHETVSSRLIPSDPLTGAPQFDSGDTSTFDVNAYAASVPPPVGWIPGDPRVAPCPAGYQLWHDSSSGGYYCFPISI